MSDRRMVVPIGHYAGQRPRDRHQVRMGHTAQTLTDAEFSLWLLSHGMPRGGRAEWTVDQVLDLASTTGYNNPDSTMHELCERGLIARVPTTAESPHAAEFARRHRMSALLTGIGDTAEHPGRYAVGVPGTTAVTWLDHEAFELWQWGPVAPTLWDFVETRRHVSAQLGRPSADGTEELRASLSDLRVLLAASCAFVDLADNAAAEHAQ